MSEKQMTLKEKYEKVVRGQLSEKLGITNPMATPKVVKVVVNAGVGSEAAKNKDAITKASADLEIITGQKPSVRRAHVSIAGFTLRAGMPVGLAVTLRGERAYGFIDKLFSIVLPRLRDFHGIEVSGFDGRGNYSLGIVEHTVFPEIDITKVDKTRGLQVTIVTNAANDGNAQELLTMLGAPFKKD